MTDVRSELEKLVKSPLKELVKRGTIDAVSVEGVLHGPGRQSYCRTLDKETRPMVQRKVTVEEYLEGNVCPGCKYYFSGWRSGWEKEPLIGAALTWLRLSTRIRNMGKVTGSTSASAVQKRLKDVPSVRRSLEEHLQVQTLPREVLDLLEGLLSDLESSEERLRSASKDDSSREKINKKLKAVMLPKRFEGQEVNLDASLHVIGVSPVPGGRGNDLVLAAVDAYSIRKDTVAVLVAPAFVYAFLLQQLFPKATSPYLVVSTPAPEDETVRETAAGLWDPEGEGALACMQATLDAAQALLG